MVARILLAVMLVVVPGTASAAGPQGMDALIKQYDPTEVAEGRIHVSSVGELTYVTGTSADGPWLEVWRRADGQWKKVAELVRTPLSPIRFGAKRGCRRTS